MARMRMAAWLLGVVAGCGARQGLSQVNRPVARPIRETEAVPVIAVPAAASTVLLQLASHAAVIFSGQVLSVERGTGCVDVRFRVDHTVRGVAASGSTKSTFYVLREWSGLWSGHPDRYRVGQRLLMLLPARGATGMSAPVGGLDGAIPLMPAGSAPVADAAGVAPVDMGAGTPELAADLRWITGRAVRPAVSAQPIQSINPVAMANRAAVSPTPLSSVLSLLQTTGLSGSSEVRNARY